MNTVAQLQLFENIPESEAVEIPSLQLGNRWYNTDYFAIEIINKCPICDDIMKIPIHIQVLTNEQMKAKGLVEYLPFKWRAEQICSRQCDKKIIQ